MAYIAQIVTGYILADFISGVGHWFEDTYLQTNAPIIGKIAIANQMHHLRPTLMCHFGYFETIKSTILVSAPIYALFAYFGYAFDPTVLSFFVATINVNEIHKWSHMRPSELSWFIRILQNYRIILNRYDHNIHHREPNTNQYCVVSGAINGILDTLGFWRAVEWIILKLTGIEPRKNNNPDIWHIYERAYPGKLAAMGFYLHENGERITH